MSDRKPEPGTIGWLDITVPEAAPLAEFYARVVGWKTSPVDMGGYSDFNMNAPRSGEPRAGVCHARGGNAGLPPCWLAYFVVADLEQSVEAIEAGGGEVVSGPTDMGAQGRYCVFRDPAGAHTALFQPA